MSELRVKILLLLLCINHTNLLKVTITDLQVPKDEKTFANLPGRLLHQTRFQDGDTNSERKLYNGPHAKVEDYPFTVQITVMAKTYTRCTGVYIHPKYVLSAGHCKVPGMKVMMLCMGQSHIDNNCFQFRFGARMIVHSVVDILGILINTPFPLFSAIGILEPKAFNIEDYNSSSCYGSGWGFYKEATPSLDLRVTEFTIIQTKKYMIFCQSETHNACGGDSGSPLLCKGRLVGIASTSSTPDCSYGDGITKYVNVHDTMDFLGQLIAGQYDCASLHTANLWVCICLIILGQTIVYT